jgi:flagellar biosynthesis protein FliR
LLSIGGIDREGSVMNAVNFLHLTVRGGAIWMLIPGLSKRVSIVLGVMSALLLFDPTDSGASFAGLSDLGQLVPIFGEFLIGIMVVVPFLAPIWAAEVLGGMIENTTNLSFASIVNPLAQGASKGLWSTVCRELTWANMIILSILPQIITAYADSVHLAAPGSGMTPSHLIPAISASFIYAAEWTALRGMPILIGCIIIDCVSGLITRISSVQGLSPIVQIIKSGTAAAWVYAVMRNNG